MLYRIVDIIIVIVDLSTLFQIYFFFSPCESSDDEASSAFPFPLQFPLSTSATCSKMMSLMPLPS